MFPAVTAQIVTENVSLFNCFINQLAGFADPPREMVATGCCPANVGLFWRLVSLKGNNDLHSTCLPLYFSMFRWQC